MVKETLSPDPDDETLVKEPETEETEGAEETATESVEPPKTPPDLPPGNGNH